MQSSTCSASSTHASIAHRLLIDCSSITHRLLIDYASITHRLLIDMRKQFSADAVIQRLTILLYTDRVLRLADLHKTEQIKLLHRPVRHSIIQSFCYAGLAFAPSLTHSLLTTLSSSSLVEESHDFVA